MAVYTIEELMEAIKCFGADSPIRWSEGPQGRHASAARRISMKVTSLHAHPNVVFYPAPVGATEQSVIETVADLARELRKAAEAYSPELRVFWLQDAHGGPWAAHYVTIELETIDGLSTVVLLPG